MDIDTHTDLETKAGIPQDAVVTHGELMRVFRCETCGMFEATDAGATRL